MQTKPQKHPILTALQLGLLVIFIAAAVNYQDILDQYALRTYKPSAEVAAIQARLSLTEKATASLYRADPQIDEKAGFNSDCDTRPHELELGCYYRGHIYVLRIDNDSLAPEMDVVMAHELLHAVWAHMGVNDRQALSAEPQSVYARVATDDLKERMAGYAKSEPGEESNELHSILGTEFKSLSPVLEAYYAKYFSNRPAIVAAHAMYQNVFSSRRAELEKELAEIRTQKGQLGVLNRQLESYKASGQIDRYNALVPRQNRLVDEINRRIALYRQGVEEYNALSKSLDSQQITDTETVAQ